MKKLTLRFAAFVSTMLVTASAFAQDETSSAGQTAAYLAAGLGLGIAAFGGALGQGRTAAAALEGIARNPNASDKLFTPMILGLALIESLVIYALVISFMLVGK
jgi:F-type H+-transporting ATPase subunit c